MCRRGKHEGSPLITLRVRVAGQDRADTAPDRHWDSNDPRPDAHRHCRRRPPGRPGPAGNSGIRTRTSRARVTAHPSEDASSGALGARGASTRHRRSTRTTRTHHRREDAAGVRQHYRLSLSDRHSESAGCNGGVSRESRLHVESMQINTVRRPGTVRLFPGVSTGTATTVTVLPTRSACAAAAAVGLRGRGRPRPTPAASCPHRARLHYVDAAPPASSFRRGPRPAHTNFPARRFIDVSLRLVIARKFACARSGAFHHENLIPEPLRHRAQALTGRPGGLPVMGAPAP